MTKREFWEKAYLAALSSPALAAVKQESYRDAALGMSQAAKLVAIEAVADLERNFGDKDGNLQTGEVSPYR